MDSNNNGERLKQDGTEKSSNHHEIVASNQGHYRYEGGPRWLFRRRELCRRHSHNVARVGAIKAAGTLN